RVYTGAHYPGDCLAGAAIGGALAGSSVRRWPVRPAQATTAPKVTLPAAAQASPEGEGLAIVINSASGSALIGDPSAALKEALPRAHITEIDMTSADELRAELERLAENASVIGIAGGDGSVNTAAEVALRFQKPLVVVPAGTLNHLSQAIGVNTVDDAISAVKSGEAVGVDVGTIAGRAFLNTASFGSYVEIVDTREKLENKIGKWPAVAVALIQVLRRSKPIRVEIDGERIDVWMAFIGNCAYHPSGFAPSWRERLDDGKIDLRYIDASRQWARLRLAAALLTGRLGRSKVYKQALVERLEIHSLDGPLRLARDGETFEGPEDIVVEKYFKRLAVYAPHAKP
ncbi:MAG TPA: diacylglycerol kinase family protein, partial [Actinomycetota bacterium]|nr:diacylglycerol kinase family protein [Actinomycetota bacterium]